MLSSRAPDFTAHQKERTIELRRVIMAPKATCNATAPLFFLLRLGADIGHHIAILKQ